MKYDKNMEKEASCSNRREFQYWRYMEQILGLLFSLFHDADRLSNILEDLAQNGWWAYKNETNKPQG
jgi:hypothetical protein